MDEDDGGEILFEYGIGLAEIGNRHIAIGGKADEIAHKGGNRTENAELSVISGQDIACY